MNLNRVVDDRNNIWDAAFGPCNVAANVVASTTTTISCGMYIYACVVCTYMPFCVSNEELSGYYLMCVLYNALRHLLLRLARLEMRLVKMMPRLLG
jgi:hypothetical protein